MLLEPTETMPGSPDLFAGDRPRLVSWASAPVEAGETLTFEKDVRPIFKAYCLDCHGGGEALKGHLDLRLKRFAERGGDSGPAVVPGRPDESLLVERLKDGEMPPGEKKVPPEQIAVIERWIAGGALTQPKRARTPRPRDRHDARRACVLGVSAGPAAARRRRSGPNDRVRTPIDAFVLAKLRERGLSFAPEADRRTLDPARGLRPHGPAPVPGSDRRLSRRLGGRRLRTDARPAHGLAAIRRALGATLARRGRLCRLRRQRQRRLAPTLCVQVPRLRGALAQRRQAARPVHRRATGRRRAGPAPLERT